ncbi:MAG: hypothetical protein A3H91_02825 [Gammaproteobacteria bacterium RIFCSPLOWO2_02_FULL_61_13]|nr:MAG: hypothetical protein A3H91_02825 [Gammaproteobacteria bacterium RIFCSPLOWO2_02_FULL_61_13]
MEARVAPSWRHTVRQNAILASTQSGAVRQDVSSSPTRGILFCGTCEAMDGRTRAYTDVLAGVPAKQEPERRDTLPRSFPGGADSL